MEEHAFYLYIYFALATLTIRSPSSFSVQDREAISARLHVYKQQDLADELSHYKASSKVNDQAWMGWLMFAPLCNSAFLLARASLSSEHQNGLWFQGASMSRRCCVSLLYPFLLV